jgi:hypothetical protein
MDDQNADTQAIQQSSHVDQVTHRSRESPTSVEPRSAIPVLPVNPHRIWQVALAVQKRNPATSMLVKQMANYVQAFEVHLNIIRQADHRCEPATEAGMGHRERSRERRGQCAIAAVSPRKLSSTLLLGRAREPALAVRRARRLDHDAPLSACCRLNVPPKSCPSM